MVAGERDHTGVVLWWGLAAGALLIAIAYGDVRHLRCLLYAGVIMACGSAGALVIRWGFTRQVPGSVTPITDAPTALELASDNERRIEELELRSDVTDTKFIAVFRAIGAANRAMGLPVPDLESTQPLPRLRVVRRGEASLCRLAVAGPLGC